jgi:hypothetical protein
VSNTILPLFILISGIAFWLISRILGSSSTPQEPQNPEPNIEELERNLKQLLEQNRLAEKMENLHQELKSSKSNLISGYLQSSKKDLQGFHLFQLILTLIRNQAEDTKIIKLMRHYLPSASTAHLYAMLKSYKKFLQISALDNRQKALIHELNQNNLRSTLIYLQQKLNIILNQIPTTPPALQQPLINQAMILGLIFASFSQFYNPDATEKILRLVASLTPELFSYWHQIPKKKSLKKSSSPCLILPHKAKPK